MRRFFILLLCLFLLTTAVCATGSVTDLQSEASVNSDGSCAVSVVFQLRVSQLNGSLQFPLPRDARDISLNGGGAKTFYAEGRRWVDFTGAVSGTGNYTVRLNYTLPNCVSSEKKGLFLNIPLLSGFDYPIENMEFSITLPGEPEELPTFSSTYHPESMDSYTTYQIDGNRIYGRFLQEMKDHESLTMRLAVSSKLFPQNILKRWSLSKDDLAQYALCLLAFLYWLLFMRCRLPRPVRQVQAPNGITAGELGCCMAGQGVDFPLMILSWAKMGYLTVHLGRTGRVLLYKEMEMGNERSEFEMRCFKTLFGRRRTVDGSSEHYGRLCRKASKTVPSAWNYFKKRTGNPLIFRAISAGIGLFGGISLAKALVIDTTWQVTLSVCLGIMGVVLCWLIQSGAKGVLLRHRRAALVALVCCLAWVILGSIAGEGNVAIFVVISQLLTGIAVIHGGRRTEAGLQARNEVLGLRKYLKSLSAGEVQRISQSNPSYFFDMLPEAIALGVDGKFTRAFGAGRQPECFYLTVDGNASMTAQQWNKVFRQVMQVLSDRQYKKTIEKLFGK
ncbi:MAG: DUF2207 domain-containing protein [Ruminococcaceae bacterium]|nr:DUF2207 domain-containing protein [Oscillospiraceae bacterium]